MDFFQVRLDDSLVFVFDMTNSTSKQGLFFTSSFNVIAKGTRTRVVRLLFQFVNHSLVQCKIRNREKTSPATAKPFAPKRQSIILAFSKVRILLVEPWLMLQLDGADKPFDRL